MTWRAAQKCLQGISRLGWIAPMFLTVGGECRPSTRSDSASCASPWITAMPSRSLSANDCALQSTGNVSLCVYNMTHIWTALRSLNHRYRFSKLPFSWRWRFGHNDCVSVVRDLFVGQKEAQSDRSSSLNNQESPWTLDTTKRMLNQ